MTTTPRRAKIKLAPSLNGTGTQYTPPPPTPPTDTEQTDTAPPNKKRRASTPTPTEQYFLAAAADDEGNARCLNYVYGRRFLYCPAYGWLKWTGTHWSSENAEAAVRKAAVTVLKRRRMLAVKRDQEKLVKACAVYNQRVAGVIALFRDMVTEAVRIFDADPDLLNCLNGVIDLRTGKLTPHDPAQRYTYCVAAAYNQQADCSVWLEFLNAAVVDPDLVHYLQVALGYTMTGRTSEECLFYLYGPTRAGKGTFTETIMHLLGQPVGKEVNFTTFTSKRDGDTQNFDLAPLKPARYVTASEDNKYDTLNAAKIKLVTGGNDLYCAFKYRDHFSYRPMFKLWLASNNPVNADPDDAAVWGRVKVIHFPTSHFGDEDKTLKDKLREPESLAGLLSWLVDGAIEWYASQPKGLQAPPSVTVNTQAARDDLDYVQHWAAECLYVTGNAAHFETNADIYASYVAWCKENGVQPKQLRGLTRSLGQKFPNLQIGVKKWIPAKSKQVNAAVGVQLR